MRPIDADALTEFLKCLLPERGMWEIEGDTAKDAICETVAEAIEMVKNMETIQPTHKVSFGDKDHVWIDGKQYISLRRFQEAVKEAQPKEGRWIEGGIYRDVIECYCSECGQLMTTAATVRMNYCPRCGARMKEGEANG